MYMAPGGASGGCVEYTRSAMTGRSLGSFLRLTVSVPEVLLSRLAVWRVVYLIFYGYIWGDGSGRPSMQLNLIASGGREHVSLSNVGEECSVYVRSCN